MMKKEKIDVLLVEDEATLALIIKDTLEESDFLIHIAPDGEQGLRMFFDLHPDVLVADVMMPHMDGFEMVRRIRQLDKQTPVLFLTARSGINDVVEGFELGANDYLKKPFGMQELIIRIKALVGKAFDFVEEKRETRFEIGNYRFDSLTQLLNFAGNKQDLSHRESEILKRLCENRDQVVSMQSILLDLWGDDTFFNTRSLHVFITKLRHKLAQNERIRIVNVRGIGYKLIVNCLFLLVWSTTAWAQTELPGDSLKSSLVPLIENIQPQHIGGEGVLTPDFTLPNLHPSRPIAPYVQPQPMTFHFALPPVQQTPWPTPRLGENSNPFARDYNGYDYFTLTPSSQLSTYSMQNTYPTMGTFVEAGASYRFTLNDHWDFSGGIYATKYTIPSFQHGLRLDAGINASLAYRINDRIRIRAVGQYSLNGQQNSQSGYLTPLAPQSYYGMIVELKVTDWLELHGGMERVFDPVKGKWSTVPVIYPVINFKKR